jgi:hypothetical protein
VVSTAPATPGTGGDDPDTIARGIRLAVSNGAGVICVGRSVQPSAALRTAVDDARRAGVIVVAADGNRAGEDLPAYPAGYDGVLAAVPLAHDGTVAVTSPSGRALGLAVPGVDITTTNSGGGYRIDAGTAAAGILAGAVALVRAAYPNLPADEVVHRLTATAQDTGQPGPDDRYGQGTVDLVGALVKSVPLLHPSPAPSKGGSPGPTPAGAAPPGPAPTRQTPLGWLLALPVLGVFGALAAYAVRARRARPSTTPHV